MDFIIFRQYAYGADMGNVLVMTLEKMLCRMPIQVLNVPSIGGTGHKSVSIWVGKLCDGRSRPICIGGCGSPTLRGRVTDRLVRDEKLGLIHLPRCRKTLSGIRVNRLRGRLLLVAHC